MNLEDTCINIDDIKTLAQGAYGVLPKSCELRQRVLNLTYPSANEYGELMVLDNPIFVTSAMVATDLGDLSSIYISASAKDVNTNSAFQVGNDGDVLVGGMLWKYVKVSGNATNGATIQITLVGYELGYSDVEHSEETAIRSQTINVDATMEQNGYFLVSDSVVLPLSALVFQNGILVSKSYYQLNRKEIETYIGYIQFDENYIHNGDIITILY